MDLRLAFAFDRFFACSIHFGEGHGLQLQIAEKPDRKGDWQTLPIFAKIRFAGFLAFGRKLEVCYSRASNEKVTKFFYPKVREKNVILRPFSLAAARAPSVALQA